MTASSTSAAARSSGSPIVGSSSRSRRARGGRHGAGAGSRGRGRGGGRPADRLPWIGCGQCAVCRAAGAALPQAAHRRHLEGWRLQRPGDGAARPLSGGLYGDPPSSPQRCACSGLTAYSAVRKLPDLSAEDSVLLIGAGGVGLSTLHVARALTAGEMSSPTSTPPSASRRWPTEAAAAIDNAAEDALAKVRELSGGGVAAAIDLSAGRRRRGSASRPAQGRHAGGRRPLWRPPRAADAAAAAADADAAAAPTSARWTS